MIKSLRDARIVDGLPRIVAGQDWVQAMSYALAPLVEQALVFADASQIYTELDTASETVLDALAVNCKIDWYDTAYDLERKRKLVKTALIIRRLMGTVHAVKVQSNIIYPGTIIEEWFEYDGTPGCFRLYVDITDTSPEHPLTLMPPSEMERRLVTSKRWSAHLESFAYQIKHALLIGADVSVWAYHAPICGTIYCGTYWEYKSPGYSVHCGVLQSGASVGYAYNCEPAGLPFCGTLPEE